MQNGMMGIEESWEKRECKRKARFPTLLMAERAADALAKEEGEGINAYHCTVCGGFHIGHSQTPKHKKESQPLSRIHKFFFQYQGVLYAKIKDDARNHYIFIVPEGTEQTEEAILERGMLVACKKGTDFYREINGEKSSNWRIYNNILPFYAKDLVQFRTRIAEHEHNMMELHDARMSVLNNVKIGTLGERLQRKIYVRPNPVEQKEEQFKGKAVFRDENNRPYISKTCKCVFCSTDIELRAFISVSPGGKLTYQNRYFPVGTGAHLQKGNARTQSRWVCAKCTHLDNGEQRVPPVSKKTVEVKKHLQPKPPLPKFSVSHYDTDILNDLKRIATDAAVEAEFVRGATVMACHLLLTK